MTNRTAPHNQLPTGIGAMKKLYRNYKARAKNDSYTFTITEVQFQLLTQQRCYYCGRNPSQVMGSSNGTSRWGLNGGYVYNGIDRKDNSIGYEYDNLVSCCKICNRAKREMPIEEFEQWIRDLIEYQASK